VSASLPTSRPRIVFVVDRPGWAHDRKTDALASALAARYEIVKVFQADLTESHLESADAVLFYYWLQIDRVAHLRPLLQARRESVLIGICSHYELEGAWREPAFATLNDLASAVFINNQLLYDEIAPQMAMPVHYTPNGVDTRFFRPPAAPSSPGPRLRVGWAGSLTNQTAAHRGVAEVIEPAVALVGGELHLAAREQKWRTAAEMVDFYHSLDVYVCASRTEGTPNPCFEAAACGLPVVTTAVGNMPEFIRPGENGFFVERRPEDMAAKLTLLRDDPELRARMGAAARASAETWDWRHQALRYEPLFDRVLGRTKA